MVYYICVYCIWYNTAHINNSYGALTDDVVTVTVSFFRFFFLKYIIRLYRTTAHGAQQQLPLTEEISAKRRWPWDKPFGRIASAFMLSRARIFPNIILHSIVHCTMYIGTLVGFFEWGEDIFLSSFPNRSICKYEFVLCRK